MKIFPLFITSFFVLFSAKISFAQSGAKWATNGNSSSTGEFLGTTNSFPLIFKTNNVQRMMLTNSGILQLSSMTGSGNGFVTLDAFGNFSRMNFPNDSNKVLGGDANFHSLSAIGGWQLSGNNLLNTNSGYVGIGTLLPQAKLHVNGDAIVTGMITSTGLSVLQFQADTIKGVSMVQVNSNLCMTSGTCSDITAAAGAVQIQSKPGAGNTVLNAGANGNVGVGTATPLYKLDVNGDERVSGKIYVARLSALPGDSEIHFGDSSMVYNDNSGYIYNNSSTRGVGIGVTAFPFAYRSLALGTRVTAHATQAIVIGSGTAANAPLTNNTPNSLMVGFGSTVPTLFVGPATSSNGIGMVGIGMTAPQYTLDVCGTIRAKEVRVNTTGCDFVFENNYSLMPIDSLDQYVNTNKHLPGIPTAKDMETDNGVALGQLNSAYLQKIEELTLYVIQLQKQNEIMQKEIDEMKGK